MINWRQILGYRTEERIPKVGDEARVIASESLLSVISLSSDQARTGDIVIIGHVDPVYDPGFGGYKNSEGVIYATIERTGEEWSFPYTTWKDFMELI
jgi:hypothetical protein